MFKNFLYEVMSFWKKIVTKIFPSYTKKKFKIIREEQRIIQTNSYSIGVINQMHIDIRSSGMRLNANTQSLDIRTASASNLDIRIRSDINNSPSHGDRFIASDPTEPKYCPNCLTNNRIITVTDDKCICEECGWEW